MGKVCKVEKLRSTFHTFHDYLNFYGEKKDDRLFTIYDYNPYIRKNLSDHREVRIKNTPSELSKKCVVGYRYRLRDLAISERT